MKTIDTDYPSEIINSCIDVNKIISALVEKYLDPDSFCVTNREALLEDINSNVLIQHSPAIVCMVEYATKSYIYVSENIRSELNITAKELMEEGLGRALVTFEECQRNTFLKEIYPKIFEHYGAYAPTDEAKDLHMTYNTLLETITGEYKWYFHQLAVISCDSNGFPRYALKFLSNIDYTKTDNVINFNIYKKKKGAEREVLFSHDYAINEIGINLSSREKEIIHWLMQGYTTNEIAGKLFLSAHTVSTHRKNILRKTNATSIVEVQHMVSKGQIVL